MIHKRLSWPGLVFALFLGLVAGCGKSDSSAPGGTLPSTLNPQLSTPSLRLHWLGKKQLAAETNAASFMNIWNLPESAALEAQTLDKLATAPWRLLKSATPLSNAPTQLLRPLLDDLVQTESYLEMTTASNQAPELVLALCLSPDRAALWQTNLPVVLASLSARGEGRGEVAGVTDSSRVTFNLQLSTLNLQLSLTRSNNWTLLAFSTTQFSTSNSQLSSLLSDFHQRLARNQNPYATRTTNYWLELQADLALLSQWSGRTALKTNLPVLDLRFIGENGNVRTTGELAFPGPAPIEMEEWNIPTNLVHDPLAGFMAGRGLRPVLKALGWNETKLGPPPNQAFFWAQEGNAALRFFAIPYPPASQQMNLWSEFLLSEINPMLANFPNTTNIPLGSFERVAGIQRLRWRGIPYIMPNVDVAGSAPTAFIMGGLFSHQLTNQPMPLSLLTQFQRETNLIFYNWEITKTTGYSLIQMAQAARFVFGRNRFSLTNNASLPWIVATSPRVGVSSSAIRLVSSDSLTFSRISTIGLTGFEMHVLADWLESPSLPQGLFSQDSAAAK